MNLNIDLKPLLTVEIVAHYGGNRIRHKSVQHQKKPAKPDVCRRLQSMATQYALLRISHDDMWNVVVVRL